MHPRNPVFPVNRHALYDEHGYSAAIRSGDLLFVSGQVGSRSDGTPEPDFAAGCTFDDLIDVTTFHTDPENQFPVIMEVKKLVFPQPPYPNWTAIGVNWLAGFDFEIKVIARIPSPAN